MTLDADKKALVDKAKAFYADCDFLDAYRLALAASQAERRTMTLSPRDRRRSATDDADLRRQRGRLALAGARCAGARWPPLDPLRLAGLVLFVCSSGRC